MKCSEKCHALYLRIWTEIDFSKEAKLESFEITQGIVDLENALTEQLLKQGYAFRGRCDGVPEDIERAFNALGICTEEHKAALEKEK